MTPDRLTFARTNGGLCLPATGRIALWGAPGGMSVSGLDVAPERIDIIQRFAPDAMAWADRGFQTRTEPEGPYAVSIVTVPRARDLAETRIAEASQATPEGLVVVDGAKTDGVDSLLRGLKSRVALDGQISKAHGKLAWFRASEALSDWRRPPMQANAEGDMVAPGVFSADGADPASLALVAALPPLKGTVVDLGAGWGWISRAILRNTGVDTLHLVEADLSALECARANVPDPRARFHWADARPWTADIPVDAVVMNPPFHSGRKADPTLGRAFIETAARLLGPHGQLWLVANRHLPYEATLGALFRAHTEVGGDARFKILHATRPVRTRRLDH